MKIKLTADVNFDRKKFKTSIMIKSGNIIVATATLPYKYDAAQALAEFVKNPQRFLLAPKFASLTPDQIRALAA